MKIAGFTAAELAKFKEYQRASYATLEDVAASLREGETEKDVTRRLRKRFHEQGVHHAYWLDDGALPHHRAWAQAA